MEFFNVVVLLISIAQISQTSIFDCLKGQGSDTKSRECTSNEASTSYHLVPSGSVQKGKVQKAINKVTDFLRGKSLDKLMVVLDLDETLVSVHQNPHYHYNHENKIYTKETQHYTSHRPGLFPFLKWLSENFELGLFTAATFDYAEEIFYFIDPDGFMIPFKNRRYRQHCFEIVSSTKPPSNIYVKDITTFREDLTRIVLIDNSILSYLLQPFNGIPIKSYLARNRDETEDDFQEIKELLETLKDVPDVRVVLNERYKQLEMFALYIKSGQKKARQSEIVNTLTKSSR